MPVVVKGTPTSNQKGKVGAVRVRGYLYGMLEEVAREMDVGLGQLGAIRQGHGVYVFHDTSIADAETTKQETDGFLCFCVVFLSNPGAGICQNVPRAGFADYTSPASLTTGLTPATSD